MRLRVPLAVAAASILGVLLVHLGFLILGALVVAASVLVLAGWLSSRLGRTGGSASRGYEKCLTCGNFKPIGGMCAGCLARRAEISEGAALSV